jgi:subtilisin family serine protease
MLKEYIVSLNSGVDYDALWNEIENDGSGSTYIPTRSVDIVNVRPLTQRACHYALSDEEAEKLRNDPRVYSVDIPDSQRDDIKITPYGSQSGTYSKAPNTPVTTWVNWGLPRLSSRTNNTPDAVGSFTYDYDIDGTGVDFVIQDSGLQCDHPDFQDGSGVNRVQRINWWTAAGQSGPPPWIPGPYDQGMPASFYTDTDGHGTHCAGIVAGKTYGRAKNARIYVMKVAGLGGTGGVDPALSFELITNWHLNKPIDPITGYKRPTVVNMSWGYFGTFTNITGGNYRGTNWTGVVKQPQYGMVGSYFSATYNPVDVVVEDCLNAGVILVGAAGNFNQTMDVPGGLDYNNYYNRSGYGAQYYMRGGSPTGMPDVINVGAVDINYAGNGKEQKVDFSNSGPRVDLYAPGTQIVSTISFAYAFEFATPPYGVNTYPYNAGFKIANVSGTSMAAPNVAGIVAQLLQMNPDDTPAEMRQRVIDLCTPDMLYDTGSTTDYAVPNTLHGSPNRYAFFPYEESIGYFIATGAISMLNVTINT